MGSGFAKKKKQAKLMQDQMAKMQEELSSLEASGEAGSGLVNITINGDNVITKVKIKPECVDPDDIEGLEDLIQVAHNKALEEMKQKSSSLMPGMGGGFPF